MTKEQFKTCFDQLFDPLRNYLYYRCGDRDIAQDIAQEAFMKIWMKQPDFDLNRIKGLLYKISGDLFVDHIRKSNRSYEYLSQIKLEFNADTPEQTMQYNDLKNQYEASLAKLPEQQRVTFLMSRIDGLKYKEIAERLNISQKAVEKRMSQALAHLKNELK